MTRVNIQDLVKKRIFGCLSLKILHVFDETPLNGFPCSYNRSVLFFCTINILMDDHINDIKCLFDYTHFSIQENLS